MTIITVSRGSLSGGKMFAQKLGERLGYKVISQEVIVEAARVYGVDEAALAEGLSNPPGIWQRLTHQKDRFLLAVQAALTQMVVGGNAIYHGLAGQFLLEELPQIIKIRLIASQEFRARSAMRERNLTHDQAVHYIEQIDEARGKWVRTLYNAEWSDPSLYDLVINLGHMNLNAAVELVTCLANHPNHRRTPERMQELKDIALRMKVRAELAFHSDFAEDELAINVHRDRVEIAGGKLDAEQQSKLLSFVRAIEGVSLVHLAGVGDNDEEATPEHRTAEDIMLPLSRYPHIEQSLTIREAIVALSASAIQFEDGHLIHPRYLLVFDEVDHLVGVINRRDLVKGLIPQLEALEHARERVEAVMHISDSAFPLNFRWMSLFSNAALNNARRPVSEVMSPIRGTVQRSDELSAVISTMIGHGVDLVPVLDGRKVLGVVLMTDVFDTVGQFVLEQGRS